jgi:hypothetical protein
MYTYIHIYIHREREKKRERERKREKERERERKIKRKRKREVGLQFSPPDAHQRREPLVAIEVRPLLPRPPPHLPEGQQRCQRRTAAARLLQRRRHREG